MSAPYHHGNLREAAVNAVAGMLEEVGPDGITLRSLATRLGVTHRALYRHFTDRSQLLSEAARRTLAELQSHVMACVNAAGNERRARLSVMADAYTAFALRYPVSYRHATHAGFAKSDAAEDLRAQARQLGATFVSIYAPAGCDTSAVRDRAIAAWGTLHGLIDLYLGGSLRARSREVAHRYIVDLVMREIDFDLA